MNSLSAPLNFQDLVYKAFWILIGSVFGGIRIKKLKLSSCRPPARETWERLPVVSENLGRVVKKTNMADKEELNFEEIHFSPIPSQTNIYGLTKIESREEGNKIFLASLSGRVVCLEYLSNSLVPTSREVPFTYIPGLFESKMTNYFIKYMFKKMYLLC